MKPENGTKKRTAKRSNVGDDRENEEIKQTQEFIFATEEKSWRESLDIIATKGSIRGTKIL